MTIETVFFDDKQRLRSGWRFAVFTAVFVVMTVVVLTPLTIIFTSAGGAPGSMIYLCIINSSILVSAVVTGWLCGRFLERLPFKTLGASFSRGWLKRFAVGAVVGILTLSFCVAISMPFDGLAFNLNDAGWNAILETFGISLVVFTIAAASEEALSRGYPMQTFFHSDLRIFGIFFTAALFASGHLGNPHVDYIAWLNTFLAGVWFGVAYWRTGDLWFPFGMHLAWNWMQGAFFGIEVSGLTDITSAPLLREIDRGPAWLTGEKYGIEAGIAATIAIVISTMVIFLLPSKSTAPE
jgi:membrane protease YdiL (CAAX protease family)